MRVIGGGDPLELVAHFAELLHVLKRLLSVAERFAVELPQRVQS